MGEVLNSAALEAARKAVEDVLIQFRDDRWSILGKGNGFVVREADGTESSIIRLSTADGLAIGIRAYLAALAADQAEAPENRSGERGEVK